MTTYYVDNVLGNDANPGTAPGAGAFQTPDAAFSAWSDGDTIVLADDQTHVPTSNTAMKLNSTLRRSGDGTSKPLLDYTGQSVTAGILIVPSTGDGCTVDGLQITGTPATRHGVDINAGTLTTGVTLKNLHVYGCGGSGMSLKPTTGAVSLTYTTVTDCANDGVSLSAGVVCTMDWVFSWGHRSLTTGEGDAFTNHNTSRFIATNCIGYGSRKGLALTSTGTSTFDRSAFFGNDIVQARQSGGTGTCILTNCILASGPNQSENGQLAHSANGATIMLGSCTLILSDEQATYNVYALHAGSGTAKIAAQNCVFAFTGSEQAKHRYVKTDATSGQVYDLSGCVFQARTNDAFEWGSTVENFTEFSAHADIAAEGVLDNSVEIASYPLSDVPDLGDPDDLMWARVNALATAAIDFFDPTVSRTINGSADDHTGHFPLTANDYEGVIRPVVGDWVAGAIQTVMGSASALVFGIEPQALQERKSVWPVFTVRLVDANGDTVTTEDQDITLSVLSGDNLGLTGTLTETTVNGIAIFDGVRALRAGYATVQVTTEFGFADSVSAKVTVTETVLNRSQKMFKIGDLTLPSQRGGPHDNRREMFSRFMGLLRPWAVKSGSLLDVELVCTKFRLPTTKAGFLNATEGEIDLLLAIAEFFYGKAHAAYSSTSTENSVVLVAQLGLNPWAGDSGSAVPLQVRQNLNGTGLNAATVEFSGTLAVAQGFDTTFDIDTLNAAVIAAGYLGTGENAIERGTHGIVYRKELFRYLCSASLYDESIDGIPSDAGALTIMPHDANLSPSELLSSGDASVDAVSTTDRAHVQYPAFTANHANIIAIFDTGVDATLQNLDLLQDADYATHGRSKERGGAAGALLVMAGLWEQFARGSVASSANYRSLQVDLRAKGLYANPIDPMGYRSATLNSDFADGTPPVTSELNDSVRSVQSYPDKWAPVLARMTLDYLRLRGTTLENEINAFGSSPANETYPLATAASEGAHWLPGQGNLASKRARDQHTLSAYIACTNYWNTNEASLFPNDASILGRFGWEAAEYDESVSGATQLNQIDPAKVELLKSQAAIAAGGYTPACKFLAPHGGLYQFAGAWLNGAIALDNPAANAIEGQSSVALVVRLLPPRSLTANLGEGKFSLVAPAGMTWSAASWAVTTPDTTATIAGVGTRTLTVTFKDSTGYPAGTLLSLLNATLAVTAAGPEVGGSYEGSVVGLLVQGVWATTASPATNISSLFKAGQLKVLSRLQ